VNAIGDIDTVMTGTIGTAGTMMPGIIAIADTAEIDITARDTTIRGTETHPRDGAGEEKPAGTSTRVHAAIRPEQSNSRRNLPSLTVRKVSSVVWPQYSKS
jgi:hypothetical protein